METICWEGNVFGLGVLVWNIFHRVWNISIYIRKSHSQDRNSRSTSGILSTRRTVMRWRYLFDSSMVSNIDILVGNLFNNWFSKLGNEINLHVFRSSRLSKIETYCLIYFSGAILLLVHKLVLWVYASWQFCKDNVRVCWLVALKMRWKSSSINT